MLRKCVMLMRPGAVVVGLGLAGLFLTAQPAAASGKISLSPSGFTLNEGQSQQITMTLDSPIIASSGSPYVEVDIVPNDPSRVSIDTPIITIPGSDWFQPFTFTVTALNGPPGDGDLAEGFSITTTSNAVYYNGFVPVFSMNVVGNPAAPAAASGTSNDPPPTVLPKVGSSFPAPLALLAAVVTAAATEAVCLVLKRRPRVVGR